MCNGNGVSLHRPLLLGGEGSQRRWIGTAVNANGETALGDPRCHLQLDLERSAPDLPEPESVFLDEIERQPVCTRWPRSADGQLDLDPLAGGDVMRQRRSGPVPDDRVAERIEPVKRRLDAACSA